MNFEVLDFDKFLSPLIISPDDERDISAKDTVGSNKSFNGYTFQTSLDRFEPVERIICDRVDFKWFLVGEKWIKTVT